MSRVEVYTMAELEAQAILTARECACTNDPRTPHYFGDRILELAERIKAERAVSTMTDAANAAQHKDQRHG